MARLATPLRNSKWVLGHEELLTRIVLNGLKGDLLMPAMGTLDDQQLAAILTYIRRAWGHEAGPISPETVAQGSRRLTRTSGAVDGERAFGVASPAVTGSLVLRTVSTPKVASGFSRTSRVLKPLPDVPAPRHLRTNGRTRSMSSL